MYFRMCCSSAVEPLGRHLRHYFGVGAVFVDSCSSCAVETLRKLLKALFQCWSCVSTWLLMCKGKNSAHRGQDGVNIRCHSLSLPVSLFALFFSSAMPCKQAQSTMLTATCHSVMCLNCFKNVKNCSCMSGVCLLAEL